MLTRLVFLVLGLAATAPVAAQNVLSPGDLGIVTTTGFYRLPGLPANPLLTHYVSPAALGLTAMPTPGVIHESGTDSFLVCSSDRLLRLTLGTTTTAITDLSPTLPAGTMLADIDLHPGTGQLVLLDTGNATALFFDPPFAAGMSPDHTLVMNPTSRSVCFDTYNYPPAVIYSRGGQVERATLDGVTSTVSGVKKADGVDNNSTYQHGTYITKQATNEVLVAAAVPGLTQNLNIVGLCQPVALGPRSIAYDPLSNWTYVLAADGLNPTCYPGVIGPNHVVAFPPAAGVFPPRVATNTLGSNINGTDGDIALVMADFAFGSPYGPLCTASDGSRPALLNAGTSPAVGNSAFAIALSDAPPNTPVFLWIGFAPAEIPLISGCTFLVQPTMSFLAGSTTATGTLTISGSIPASTPIGTELWLQACLPDGSEAVYSTGLMLHIGLE
jgi:hypothetical protein